jgi:hypothetical protein
MAAETYVIGGLGSVAAMLFSAVAFDLNRRLTKVETRQELGDTAAHALAIAVAQLTTEVTHLKSAIERLTGGG